MLKCVDRSICADSPVAILAQGIFGFSGSIHTHPPASAPCFPFNSRRDRAFAWHPLACPHPSARCRSPGATSAASMVHRRSFAARQRRLILLMGPKVFSLEQLLQFQPLAKSMHLVSISPQPSSDQLAPFAFARYLDIPVLSLLRRPGSSFSPRPTLLPDSLMALDVP